VPYTACKLVTFEMVSGLMQSAVQAHAEARSRVGRSPLVAPPNWLIVLSSGLLAGAAAAVVSQPFDLLLTRICGSSAVVQLSECVLPSTFRGHMAYIASLGPAAFTGLAPRLAMISVMTACQFFLYDALRTALQCGAPACDGCAATPISGGGGARSSDDGDSVQLASSPPASLQAVAARRRRR
jgi:solute carrier family 25 phosphate transporter 3